MTDLARIALLAALASGGLLLVSCSERTDADGHDVGDAHSGHDHSDDAPVPANVEAAGEVYTDILGIVQSLPVAGNPASELRIHHEHIPGFKTQDGTVFVAADGVRGMKSMTMAFPVAEGLDISTMRVGDKIRFDFVVTWGGTPPWSITRFEKLDPATEIDFSNKATDVSPADDEQP